jgi:pectate lyase
MRYKRWAAIASACVVAGATVAVTWPASAGTATTPSAKALQVARQALPAGDGWAASGTGTTGGAAADDAHVFVVRNRSELIAALGGDNATNRLNATPKIIFINGRIDANVNDANEPLTCADYADPAYSLDAYLAAYDPAVWGRVAPTGPLEEARVRSTQNQRARVMINVGSNTTIVGINGAKLSGANLILDRVTNVILRNVTFADAHDCFPAWTPTDGAEGNWNSLYDTVTLTGATNVWVDHNAFDDGNNDDALQPRHFNRPYQVHDGSLDIIRASDLVTVSWNHFRDHDKTMLIGSTNTVGADVGKLRVTLHHNRFANNGQRLPRVRFGQVDIYNNYFYFTDEETFSYAWGVGVYASLYAENNFLLRSADIPLEDIVFDWRGTAPGNLTEVGTLARVGTGPINAVSLLGEYNATHDPDITSDGGWTPTLRPGPLTPTVNVPTVVGGGAGTGKLGIG